MAFRTLIPLFALAVITAPLFAEEKVDPKKSANKAAKTMLDAMIKGEYEKFVDHLRPEMQDRVGGRESMIKLLTNSFADFKRKGISLHSYEFTETSEPLLSKSNIYLTVGYTLFVNAPDEKFKRKCYLIGSSTDSGKTWKFIDGSEIGEGNAKILRKLIPDIPEELKLPKSEAPVKIKD